VEIRVKSGKSISRLFPDVLINLTTLAEKNFVLNGELVIPVDGALSLPAWASASAGSHR
jgi:ATP-dependent DNA ligase